MALRINHQPCIQKTSISIAFCRHALNGWTNHAIHHRLENFISDHGCCRISAHTACIWAFIAIISGSMVLRSRHGQDVFTIRHHNKTRLFAHQKFLNPSACVARCYKYGFNCTLPSQCVFAPT